MKQIKSFIKTASLNELEKAASLIQTAIHNHATQQAAKDEALAFLKEKGLTLEDLMEGSVADKRSKVAIKYRREVDGEVHEWTGRGRRPKAFVDVDLEQYAI